MTSKEQAIPTGSQTVGPFFKIGLEYLIERASAVSAGAGVEICGKVLDRDGAPVPDAVLEFWSPGIAETPASVSNGHPIAFRRVATGGDGSFSIVMAKPAPLALENGSLQAPHMLVLVFARGLLRHLITRVYFEDEPGNAADAVLREVPLARRGTLIAKPAGERTACYLWNVVLQGEDETVFFAW